MAGAGGGDVAEAGAERIRMDAGVGVDEDALGGESLGAVAGNGVACRQFYGLMREFFVVSTKIRRYSQDAQAQLEISP